MDESAFQIRAWLSQYEKKLRECDNLICTWEAWHPVSMPDGLDYTRALLFRETAIEHHKRCEKSDQRRFEAWDEARLAHEDIIEAWSRLRALHRAHMPKAVHVAESL